MNNYTVSDRNTGSLSFGQGVANFYKVSKENYDNIIRLIDIQSSYKHHYTDYNDIKMPQRKTKGSSGYDFFLTRAIALQPGQTVLIPTFVRCAINTYWDLSIYPRSGLGFKYNVRLANTVGIIDSDYSNTTSDGLDNEGHILVKLFNSGNQMIVLSEGDRFCQGIFRPYGTTIDDEQSIKTVRNGGIGSTGL